jgi:hypothetical protein
MPFHPHYKIEMTAREIKLNEARERGRNAYSYLDTRNPYRGTDEAMASAWNDGWMQGAEAERAYYEW